MKKKLYLVLDTETASLPFLNTMSLNANEKKNLSIAKPLVYDIGWCILDKKGNLVKKENFLIQETFFVPPIFDTAYYKEKRSHYMNLLKEKKIKVALWDDVINVLITDMQNVYISCAYNAPFDFKKAIPFTESYICNLYSNNYDNWINSQYKKCCNILNGKDKPKNENFLNPIFKIRDYKFPIVDLWGLSCKYVINNTRYKNNCLKNKQLSNSGMYFSTNAETTFQYIAKQQDFQEEHTALSDAIIESKILLKILHSRGVQAEIESFPFKHLGKTYEYVMENKKYISVVKEALENYYPKAPQRTQTRIENILEMLETGND